VISSDLSKKKKKQVRVIDRSIHRFIDSSIDRSN